MTTGNYERIELNGDERRLTILARPPRTPNGLELQELRPKPGTVGLVVAASLSDSERDGIEQAGLSWCDARGAVHLSWPGLYFHVDHGTRKVTRSYRVTEPGLGVASIRGVQTMLSAPGAPWSVSVLAKEAALSTGQAHNVLKIMERNHLVRVQGVGPKMRRYLRDRDETLEWLAGVERGRRRPEAAAGYLYARTFDDLIERFVARASEAEVTYALTATSGAVALGHAVLTSPRVLQVRVSPGGAAQTLAVLGLEPLDADEAGRGMNLELWTDSGELGTYRSEDAGRVHVAPRVRIWLDMVRQGGRTADAAELFKEQALD
ncbi:hypothetical protein [Jiangella sp. DSM 45060]|uniref:hypothetical protein n=1 Tax=Jiangella sp. DSM 45060 TaxID=1798224 RepID=UPI0012FE2880|nr:hypothetical protein [Jiangella sp. DSM 45060]